MSGRRDRLRLLVEWRRRQREQREAEMLAVVRDRRAREIALERNRAHLVGLGDDGGRPPARALAPEWEAFGGGVSRAFDAVRNAESGLAEATARLDEARTRLFEAKAREEAIERHRDKLRAEERREQERRLERELDDLIRARDGKRPR